MAPTLQILHLEDDLYDVELIEETIKAEGLDFQTVHVFDREGFLSAVERSGFDLILADFALPGFSGKEALMLAQEKCPDVPFIFVSGAIGEELAIETLKLGATDYVLKDRLSRLVSAIQRALREVDERARRRRAQEQLRQSKDQLEAILSGITDGISVQRPDGNLIYANDTAARIMGYPSVQALLEAPVEEITQNFEIRDEWNMPFPLERLPGRLALQGQKPSEILLRFTTKDDNREQWSVTNATPIFDVDGRVLFAVNIFRDVTERTRLYIAEREAREAAEAAAKRIASLQDVTAALSQALLPEQVAQVVLEQGINVFGASAGSVMLLNNQGTRLELLSAVGYKAELLQSWRQFSVDAPAPLAEAVRTGKPIFLKDQNESPQFSAILKNAPDTKNKSWASIPLLVEERVIGAMGLSFHQPQPFEADDRDFILTLSRHCAQALERARLFEAERAAREEATLLNVELDQRVHKRTADLLAANKKLVETNARLEEEINERLRAEADLQRQIRRTTALVRTAAHFNAELDLPKVLMAVCEEAARGMQVEAAIISLYDPHQDALVHAWSYGLPDSIHDQLKPLPLSVYEAFIQNKGSVIVTSEIDQLKELPNLELYRSINVRSMASLSLVEKGQLLGRLLVASIGVERHFGENDLTLLQGLVDQAGGAIQNARLLQEIRTNREQLRQLTNQVINAQEAERQHLSRELHDELGQVMAVFKINLEMLLAEPSPNLLKYRNSLVNAIEMANEMMIQIRDLAYDLRPPALDTLGLEPTLQIYCRDFSERAKIAIKYKGTKLPFFPETICMTFYRLLQEALTNIVRHSGANLVQVNVDYTDGRLSLTVSDNGKGFDKDVVLFNAAPSNGLGLLGMKERIQLLGGSLEITTKPGHGTRLVASVLSPTDYQ